VLAVGIALEEPDHLFEFSRCAIFDERPRALDVRLAQLAPATIVDITKPG
jgi:hypothetical protein